MIVSASYKTDIPAFYGAWFRQRLSAGFADVASPYGGPPQRVRLDAAAAGGFVFWTRNVAPFLPILEDLAAAGRPFVVQYTITGYPRPLDRATITADQAVAQLHALAARFGPRVGVWRYDPIVFTSLTPAHDHRQRFAGLARRLAGAVDEVVVSVAQIYRKTARNLAAAAGAHGFTWDDPDADTTRALLADLAGIAAAAGLRASLCGQRDLLVPGMADARCIDAQRLAGAAGAAGHPGIAAPGSPHRKGCGCAPSKDIGAYDSCPHGCVYCYAVSSRPAAQRRHARHRPDGTFLIPPGGC